MEHHQPRSPITVFHVEHAANRAAAIVARSAAEDRVTGSGSVTDHREARDLLGRGLDQLDWAVSDPQQDALIELAALLCTWAARINLTGHRTVEGIVGRLILDAAALAAQLPPLPNLADIGSGAGFPGLPIAILRDDCQVTLIESRQRRNHFQRAAIRELGIENAFPVLGRAEQLPAHEHDGVIAQAVAPVRDVLSLMLPWSRPGGLLLLPGSERPTPTPDDDRVSFDRCVSYQVPCGGPPRTLWFAYRR